MLIILELVYPERSALGGESKGRVVSIQLKSLSFDPSASAMGEFGGRASSGNNDVSKMARVGSSKAVITTSI